MYYITTYLSPVGLMTLASEGEALVGLWIENQKYFASTAPIERLEKDNLPVFISVKKWLDRYFAGENPKISELPLAPMGGEFRKKVWEILCDIPYGETITYGEIAKKLAANMNKPRMSSQAVGGAIGHNPISIIIPCHRVLGAKGSLTGYAGGVDKKLWLLTHEGVAIEKLTGSAKGAAL